MRKVLSETQASPFGASQPSRQPLPTTLLQNIGAGKAIELPIPDPQSEERARKRWRSHGQNLARQEDWVRLSGLIETADAARKMTPGGYSVSELLAAGARADIVEAVEHALTSGDYDDSELLLAGIEDLETVLQDLPQDPFIAAIVALAHLDIGRAWCDTQPQGAVSKQAQEACDAHKDRAAEIIEPFLDDCATSPFLLSTRCAMLCARRDDFEEIYRTYETLFQLNPLDTRKMRALGTSLLPSRYGSYEQLEETARRIGAKLKQTWGAGGYSWVMLDAICADNEACARLDTKLFLKGIRDILSLRSDPHTANLLAAYTGVSLEAKTGSPQADANRADIRRALRWIVRDHLTELHPVTWAHAAHGFDGKLRIRSLEVFIRRGLEEAQRVLDMIFLPEGAQEQKVVPIPIPSKKAR